ncbi:ethanolamine ammonia-lyase subunit EutB [Sporomusa acidovorans]|uniref:Ethanolamine ammonia-lyase large subunit n=1 Tax=Sporomusa acidovorans (strain ATCC 49682 / DSM 3132 / Mol) TaxID=1123286 RepID=A0ABZ3JB33_SPOA4|nr:ethanolamine ammonia-lyase subunit EutB [Sporomusa acidovorans]OZC21716.1 ethanolamine ammonia-lyase heavy chain [Sporomusa acidovorans DSM 3132]SDD59230.1 Ethanolamine ammonia-lyase heavy chain [Sporomusa acidovorans]
MNLKCTVNKTTFHFKSVRDILAKANEEKSGDFLGGIAATTATERVAAKLCLANLTLRDIYENPVIPYEKDEVTRAIYDGLDSSVYKSISLMTVGELREYILQSGTQQRELLTLSGGLTSEMIAAVGKLMSNMDLVYAAKKIRVEASCNTTIGSPGTLAFRNQPNHPTDSIEGILASTKEGLSFGSGDAVIGVNPVEDNIENFTKITNALHELVNKYKIPTQTCVLAHVTTQMQALEKGVPVDLVFQSLAGTESANSTFGITVPMLDEAYAMAQRLCVSKGPNFLYFETGQGSEISLDEHHDVDEMTLEARCYGLARRYHPFMLNNVSGFIGPETIYSGREVIRADLEDLFMGKMHGLPMGIAPCYTNHMKADQNDQEIGTMLCAMAGSNYFMGVPGGDDCMLSYQDTSYHDDATIREILGLRPLSEFERWLESYGIMQNGFLTTSAGDASIFT